MKYTACDTNTCTLYYNIKYVYYTCTQSILNVFNKIIIPLFYSFRIMLDRVSEKLLKRLFGLIIVINYIKI